MTRLFAPGCALMLYKPHLAERLRGLVAERVGPVEYLHACCRHVPPLPPGAEVVNVCPGCDRRYRQNYEHATTVSAWEIVAGHASVALPDYGGRPMSVLDACPTRDQARVHDAVREVVRRMNVTLVEPKRTRAEGTCCGDSLWGEAPADRVADAMRRKAATMPADEIVVYCVTCAKAMALGGKRPRYLVDLVFGEETAPGVTDPTEWHRQLDEYIESHI
ncbi:MAG: (Fe-S)-binding protein [Candidatus Eisenbacteria bacterium]|nr:(Fe-S)-binding protein [Candidatus Eisenbacteria bacterium]